MQILSAARTWRPFFFRIILPTVFTITLCVIAIFVIIIPTFEASMLAGKRQMIKELTSTAWSIIDKFAQQQAAGLLSPEEAQGQALVSINFLRYGDEVKDYFWVTDLTPRMLMHPYRQDLNGQDLKDYRDPDGKHLFVEFADIATRQEEGYVRYVWEDKNDPDKMVPKLSYVKLFKPWGWVIGTGIYLEDVDREIETLTGRLLRISLLITAIIVLLLSFVTRESLKIETERREKTEHLRASREKYRKLVEASTEGVLMILDGTVVYSNKLFRDLTGYSGADLIGMSLAHMLEDPLKRESPDELVLALLGPAEPRQREVVVRKKAGDFFPGRLSVSPVALGGRPGHIVTLRDIGRQKQVEGELGKSREQYRHLIENVNVGVFRTTVGRGGRIVEANPACAAILGMASLEELSAASIRDLFVDDAERRIFLRKLARDGRTEHYPIRLRHRRGGVVSLSLSVVLARDESGRALYCDGLVEDISARHRFEEEQSRLAAGLENALLFLNEPIRPAAPAISPSCLLTTPGHIAAKLIRDAGSGALLVRAAADSACIGIVTDHDLSRRLLAADRSADTPVAQIMSAPLVSVAEDALMFEGLLAMIDHDVGHLALTDRDGRVTGVVGAAQLLRQQKYPLALLLRDIRRAESPIQLIKVRERLPALMRACAAGGLDPRTLTRIVSAVAEAVMQKCISFAGAELGPPPCRYAFLTLGSVGREEQTLVTDQDNAIVYEDVPAQQRAEAARYFLAFGERVCTWLDSIGYRLCTGEVMAMNPKWCQPLSVWQDYFKQWVSTLEPADLLETKIFFDFRGISGDFGLIDELRGRLHELVTAKPLFLFHLVHNCLQFKPPLGIFKTIVVESAGEHREKFSIKKAMTPIVDFARIYALRHRISETNTSARLAKLHTAGQLSPAEYRELTMVYRALLDLRFKHQILALEAGREPDNHVNPKDLSAMEQAVLREALSQIAGFQTKMSFDFTGTA